MEVLEIIILVIYVVAGWWAINKVWYSKRVYLVSDSAGFYIRKLVVAIFLGWLCIPIAIIMKLLGK